MSPSDIKFTSAATNDSFMLKPANYDNGDVIAIDRAYIDYAKFEELTNRGVTKFPVTLFLWGKRECHQNTDLGYAYSKPPSDGHPKEN